MEPIDSGARLTVMMSFVRRKSLVVNLIVVGTVAIVGTGSAVAATAAHSGHGAPVIRTAPTTAPSAGRHDGTCQVKGEHPFATGDPHGLVWVREHPTSVVSVWVPGLNTKRAHCATARRVSGQKIASRLAAAIEDAKRLPRGIFCPLDDGTGVLLYFTYANGHDEYVRISLSGCHAVAAPGRAGRESTAAIGHELKQVAPHRWAGYV